MYECHQRFQEVYNTNSGVTESVGQPPTDMCISLQRKTCLVYQYKYMLSRNLTLAIFGRSEIKDISFQHQVNIKPRHQQLFSVDYMKQLECLPM